MANWRLLYRRAGVGNIVSELGKLQGVDARSTAQLMLEATEDPTAAKAAMALAFDDPAVTDLMIFSLGDGSAMSGIMIASRRKDGVAAFVVTLMD